MFGMRERVELSVSELGESELGVRVREARRECCVRSGNGLK